MNEELKKRLLATFKIEAGEHLQNIRNGLLQLESLSDSKEKLALLEEIYRSAHSLKGAARAVSLTDIVDLCQNVENIFSALKKGEILPNEEMFNLTQDALAVIENFISEEDENARILMYDDIQKYQILIEDFLAREQEPAEQVKQDVGGSKEEGKIIVPQQPKVEKKRGTPPKIEKEQKLPKKPKKAEIRVKEVKKSETVRVEISKLENALLTTEELLPVKISFSDLAKKLSELLSLIDTWKTQWNKSKIDYASLKERLENVNQSLEFVSEISKLTEFLDFNEAFGNDFYERLNQIQKQAASASKYFANILFDLDSELKEVLMLPFSYLTDKYPPMVWDIARQLGKKINFEIIGADVEVDKRILEELNDPLIHILRNSIDHGIEYPEERLKAGKEEKGKITLQFLQAEDGRVQIVITDDGKGIDVEEVKATAVQKGVISQAEVEKLSESEAFALIFKSDFSTAKVVTELSGRGLGMAIVKEKINKLEGSIKIESQKGKGTTITLSIPLVLSSLRGLIIEAAGRKFAFNIGKIQTAIEKNRQEVLTVGGKETIEYFGKRIAVVSLASLLGLQEKNPDSEKLLLLVFALDEDLIAVAIDKIITEQEILLKPLPPQFKKLAFVEGGTISPQGEIIPVLNVSDIFKALRKGITVAGVGAKRKEVKAKKKILVVDDSITSRVLLTDILTSVGYEAVPKSDGKEAWTELQQNRYDLVLTDVEMPRMDGFELTKKIRESKEFSDLPVVLITGLATKEDKEKGIEAGANAYIVKSDFEQDTLLEIIRKFV